MVLDEYKLYWLIYLRSLIIKYRGDYERATEEFISYLESTIKDFNV